MKSYELNIFIPRSQVRFTIEIEARDRQEFRQIRDMYLKQNPTWMVDKFA